MTGTIVLAARSKRGTTKCARCEREGLTEGLEKMIRPPAGWWLILGGEDGPPFFFLLCPPCAAEAAGNMGEFMQVDRTKRKK